MIRRSRSLSLVIGTLAVLLTLANFSFADEAAPGFFRFPDVYGDWVVFTSEGDLWKAPLAGGSAVRLTTADGEERYAHFSPDGQWIAYSGQEDGHDDVFVIPEHVLHLAHLVPGRAAVFA